MANTGTLLISTSMTNLKAGIDLSTPEEVIAQSTRKRLTGGSLWHDQISLSATEVSSLDVNDGTLTDVYGDEFSLSAVTSLYISAPSTNTGSITVSGVTNSFINTLPALSGGEAVGFQQRIDVTSNSVLALVADVSGVVDVVITGE